MIEDKRTGNHQMLATSAKAIIAGKFRAYVQLLKFRLSFFVAFSAVFGFVLASGGSWQWWQLLLMGIAGLLITGASNTLNQVFEKQEDGLMKRTKSRPMPMGKLTNHEAVIYAFLLSVVGIALLGHFFNLPAALLGIIGLLSYAFVYTPMKKISSFSVFVGAIPGALPPLIGWVAFSGSLDAGGLILFAFQFFWQFPHFWAIAWLLDEDYKKAGFKMLPTASGKSKSTAILILIYTLSLVPLAMFPFLYGMVTPVSTALLAIAGLLFAVPAFQLYRKRDDKPAKQLMFSSFLYLPVIQLIFYAGAVVI